MFGPVPGLDTCPGLGSGSNPLVVFLLGSEEGVWGSAGFPWLHQALWAGSEPAAGSAAGSDPAAGSVSRSSR